MHTVKGVAANLGATALAAAAADLEGELKQGRCPEALQRAFSRQVEASLATVRPLLETEATAAQAGAAVAALPPERWSASQRQLLARFRQLLEQADGEALDRLEQQRHELTQLLGSSGYAAVSQCLQRFDFAAASASLAPIGLQEQNDPPAGPAPAWGDPAGSPDQPLPGIGCSPPIDP